MNVTTSLRHHWTEEGFRSILIAVPMGILFNITPVEAGIVTMFTGQWGYLIHANIRLPLGPFSTVLLGPQAHRIHHSIEPQHKDRNFAAFFPIWDILFRTFYFPKRDEFPDTGIVEQILPPKCRTSPVFTIHCLVADGATTISTARRRIRSTRR